MSKTFSLSAPKSDQKRQGNDPVTAAHARLAEAEMLRNSGQAARAAAICEELLKSFPTYVAALCMLGLIRMEQNDFSGALPLFTKAAMLNPVDWSIRVKLGDAYLRLGATDLAAQTLDEVRRHGEDAFGIHAVLGEIHFERNEFELAVECFQRALEQDPDNVAALHGMGCSYQELGRLEDAAAAFQRAFGIAPGSPGILHPMSMLPARLLDMDLLAAVDAAAPTNPKDGEAKSLLGFAKALALQNAGRHEEAWHQLAKVNGELKPVHSAGWEREKHRMQRSRENAKRLPVLPSANDDKPQGVPMSLYILGPSRSGKTSLERLVATIEGVKQGRENGFPNIAATRTFQLSGLLTLRRLSMLPSTLHTRFSEIYVKLLKDHAGDAKVLTCTTPGAIHDVGFTAKMAPNCRFIFMKRDKYDTAVRIFGKLYNKSENHFAYDIHDIFGYLDWYYEMIDLWSKMLPNHSTTVSYEDMVADPAATLQQVSGFCDLPMATGPLPKVQDDRGCAEPYRALIDAAPSSRA